MKKLCSIAMMVVAVLVVMSPANVHADLFFEVSAISNSVGDGTGLDTGLSLSAGQAFTVSAYAHDLWSAGDMPRMSNADGLKGDFYAIKGDDSTVAPGALIGVDYGFYTNHGLSAPYGALVGELSGTYFLLGTDFHGTAVASGILKLYYWDSNSGDNAGSVRVSINADQPVTNAVPEPGTMLLLGSGLLGMAAFRKKFKR